jgi:hypothetical protein
MTKAIEIVDPFEQLTGPEQRTLEAVFDRRRGPDGRDEFMLRPGVSGRLVLRGHAVVEKLRRCGSLKLPEPPTPGEWRVWQHRQAGWKVDALAAADAPVRGDLHGSTFKSRRQLVMRAERAVEAFRRTAPAWWFRICAELMSIENE